MREDILMRREAAWKKADAAVDAAEEEALAAMRAALRVGDFVRYRHGDYFVRGEILWVSDSSYRYARVGLRSTVSDKEYSIHASRILSDL